MIQQETMEFSEGGDRFVGQFLWDDAVAGPRPGIMVAPAFWGLSEFEIGRARALAEMGYAVLAVDYYGEGSLTTVPEEARGWKDALEDDRAKLIRRMQAALAAIRTRSEVDAARIGAMGYCFGGKAVLDLARSGADVLAVAPLHGIFDRPDVPKVKMDAAVLVLHGWADALALPEAVVALGEELDEVCADWQLLALGHTAHGFTNPTSANYSQSAADRSWAALTRFFAEKLS